MSRFKNNDRRTGAAVVYHYNKTTVIMTWVRTHHGTKRRKFGDCH